jgi:AcrR family transcriptional regulator
MPRSSREKSAETRARIANTAYLLFLERGYHATAMRDIARRAEVTVGAIYNHFATKEDIWIEVLKEKHPYHEIFPILRGAQGETVAEAVRSAARGLVRELLNRPDLLNLMFIELVEFQSRHISMLYQAIAPEIAGLQDVFQGKRGLLRGISQTTLARSFAGLFFSYTVTGLLLKDLGGITIDEVSLEQVVDLYLYGILAEEDPSRRDARAGMGAAGAEAAA